MTAVYYAFLRETGSRRMLKLGDKCLTDKKIHAIRFHDVESAWDAVNWIVEHNPGAFDKVDVRAAS